MLANFPRTIDEFMRLDWPQIEPFYNELSARELTAASAETWLTDWSRLAEMVDETQTRLSVEKTRNTADAEIERRYNAFLDTIYPKAEAANQALKEKLLNSKLTIPGMEIPLRNMRAEADLFRDENLPLMTDEHKMRMEFDKIVGAQTVTWEGEERTLVQMSPVLLDADRGKREQAWRLVSDRQLQNRETLNELWKRFFDLRVDLASNADLADYRAYIWRKMLRFDYTPENCKQFADAIEQVVVPAAARIYERRRQQLGVDTLRPWDLDVDPLNREPLHPFDTGAELDSKGAAIFKHVDPELGVYYETMRRENLLDLENRKNKAPGGYCTAYAHARKPFILMNAVGLHGDVQTLLHEAGHAFHVFETAKLPYIQQLVYTAEIAEVASMSMELLSASYLTADQGGYYSAADAARARIEHLEGIILFWPYMAVVDGFQQWAYENPAAAVDPANCDAQWSALWDRFMKGIDWSGFDDAKATGWQRKLHIFQYPFYYVDYGLAQLGAVQVWKNSLTDKAKAIQQYRHALSLGGTRTLPELFSAAGAKFAFDAGTLREAVDLLEGTIASLE